MERKNTFRSFFMFRNFRRLFLWPADNRSGGKIGFTLIELLIVIAIIGILAGISVFAFGNIQKSARDGKRKADLENIRSALEIYRTDCKIKYPANGEVVFGGILDGPGSNRNCSGVVYMQVIPNDSTLTYKYYYHILSVNTYVLCAHLENSTAVTVPACGNNCGRVGVVGCNYAVYNP